MTMPKKEKYKSYLLEVVATNSMQGRQVVLETYREATALGMVPETLQNTEFLKKPVLKGFQVTCIPRTNGIIPGQQEVIDHARRYPMLYDIRHRPVIGEIVEGPFRGKHIVLFAVKDIIYYFSFDAINRARKAQSVYGSVHWKNANTLEEAEKQYRKPDQKYLRSVFRRRYKYPDRPATWIEDQRFKREINLISIALRTWGTLNDLHQPIDTLPFKELAKWCHRLNLAIQTREQYLRIKDTLLMLQDILVKGNPIRPLIFMGHCKILERLAEEVTSD